MINLISTIKNKVINKSVILNIAITLLLTLKVEAPTKKADKIITKITIF